MERGIPDKGPGGWGRRDGGTPRRDRGFVPDCLFAGNRGWIKASRFASRFSTSFCRISIAIGHDSAGPTTSLLPSSTIDTSEREPGCGGCHLCTFSTRIVYFRAAYPAREPISPSLFLRFLEYYPFSFFFFFCPSITTPRFNPPKRKAGKKSAEREREREGDREFLGNERQTFYFATIQQPPIPSSLRSHLTTIRSVLPARCQDLALSAIENEWKNTAGGGGREKKKHPALLVPA